MEESGIVEFGLQITAANGFADRVKFVKDRSQNVVLSEPVDVIVSDTGASFGLQDGMLGTLIDARTRFLKPGGQIIPQSVDLLIAPIDLKDGRDLDVWTKDRYGLTYRRSGNLRPTRTTIWFCTPEMSWPCRNY